MCMYYGGSQEQKNGKYVIHVVSRYNKSGYVHVHVDLQCITNISKIPHHYQKSFLQLV